MTALGVSLLVIGAVVIVVEAHVPTLGVLGGPGVVAMGIGTVLAVAGLGGGVLIAILAALLVVAIGLSIVGLSVRKGMAVRRRRVSAGPEGMIGHIGVVQSWHEPTGKVLIDGGLWHARHGWGDDDAGELRVGDQVVVEHLNGLTLRVRAAEEWELAP